MTSRLEVLRNELGFFIESNQKKVVLRIMANLTDSPPGGTPVDTSFATTNWIPSLESPFEGVAGSKKQVNESLQSAGLSEVTSAGPKRGSGGRFVGRDIFIVNNAPYIGLLNFGTSAQSPAGFVEVAIARALQDKG